MIKVTKVEKLFPTIEEVFEAPKEWFKYVFFPLLTVEIENEQQQKSKAHFVSMYACGLAEYESERTDCNWFFVRFEKVGDKYRFDGEMNWLPNFSKLPQWYQNAKEDYAAHKDLYLNSEVKHSYDPSPYKESLEKWEAISGDYATYMDTLLSYWVTRDKYQETGKFIAGNHYTQGYSGHEREIYELTPYDEGEETYEDLDEYLEYRLDTESYLCEEYDISLEDKDYLGYVIGYNYLQDSADTISLFISPDEKEVYNWFSFS